MHERRDIKSDFEPLVKELLSNSKKAKRVIVYCRSMNMCSDIYIHFLTTLGKQSYYPDGAEQISDNRATVNGGNGNGNGNGNGKGLSKLPATI